VTGAKSGLSVSGRKELAGWIDALRPLTGLRVRIFS